MTFIRAYFQRCAPPSARRGPCPAWRPRYRACRPGPPWPRCAAGLDVWPRSAGELYPQPWGTRGFRLTRQTVHLNSLICENNFCDRKQVPSRPSILRVGLNVFNVLAGRSIKNPGLVYTRLHSSSVSKGIYKGIRLYIEIWIGLVTVLRRYLGKKQYHTVQSDSDHSTQTLTCVQEDLTGKVSVLVCCSVV